ncbi:M4 family metallopeptidase [Salinibacterium sp. G-O1]|uniref:M4 family metallopeptidase n=1 Tax=Salinibacterium sp. G-O1 TaxID=3046208 RepID=UPI0024BAE3FE|nr:M4 family metallopeptidase [Salinibacterium sp. G-O1]MDJ0334965.1 M4 family metallopeptidase [Salinibacterium sp. G-O1]
MTHGIIPPYLLRRISRLDDAKFAVAAHAARVALKHDREFRSVRFDLSFDENYDLVATLVDAPDRTVSDAGSTESLPGTVVRSEGDAPVGDAAVDEAYDGLGATFALYSEVYGRNSIDGAGLPLNATVHYGDRYDNAFWDGERMVFGDGDGEIFSRFTASLSVIGHELSHGVTQYSASLVYRDQSGALNESVSDVFGALVEQHSRNESVGDASWLIGEGIFTDEVEGSALRSLKAPGTAYDDDILGKDPQPAHFDDFVYTDEDGGGVHLNSGIPNRAFYLVAEALGGNAWDRAGQIWYDTITGPILTARADFSAFAAATLDAAGSRYGSRSAEVSAVRAGWAGVGIRPASAPRPAKIG